MSDAKSQKTKKPINQNLTVPNAMSVFRILVIPFFAYFFLKGNLTAAIVALGLSGLSDALDGMIARHFNQITELGKMLDPLADKLTQGTVAICIAVHYPSIWPLLALLVLKELVMLCGACYLLKNGKKPCAAKWYGKVSTTLFYIAIGLIVVMDGFMKVSESTFNIASTTALVITAVDALPVFGTGTILIPWALVLFLRGQTKTGVGLVVLYGAAALSRQALEPRLVGKQVGLNPVLTLLALYTGYRLLGVGGMIVFPITAMLLKQIWDHSGLQPEG